MKRPLGVTALSVFFVAGAVLAAVAGLSLAFPDSMLEPLWRLNPRGHHGLAGMRGCGVLLLTVTSLACGSAGLGLWRGRAWGHTTALVVLVVQLAGDILNVVSGAEPRAIVGVPIVAAMLLYLVKGSTREACRGQTSRAPSG